MALWALLKSPKNIAIGLTVLAVLIVAIRFIYLEFAVDALRAENQELSTQNEVLGAQIEALRAAHDARENIIEEIREQANDTARIIQRSFEGVADSAPVLPDAVYHRLQEQSVQAEHP